MSNANEVVIEPGTPVEGFTFDEVVEALVYKTLRYVKRVGSNEACFLRIVGMCWMPDDTARFEFVDEKERDDEGKAFSSYLNVCLTGRQTTAYSVLWNPIPTN